MGGVSGPISKCALDSCCFTRRLRLVKQPLPNAHLPPSSTHISELWYGYSSSCSGHLKRINQQFWVIFLFWPNRVVWLIGLRNFQTNHVLAFVPPSSEHISEFCYGSSPSSNSHLNPGLSSVQLLSYGSLLDRPWKRPIYWFCLYYYSSIFLSSAVKPLKPLLLRNRSTDFFQIFRTFSYVGWDLNLRSVEK